MSQFHFHEQETSLLHGGQKPDPTTGARAVPIYQTTAYVFPDTKHAQDVFGLKKGGNIYSRIGNPTVDTFEQRIALLEDGTAAVATSSGMAAITLTILNIAGAGDEIIADANLYGGTYNLFANTLPKYGIHVTFVDGTDPAAIKTAITDRTKAIYGEIITNPSLNVFDVESVAEIAHENDIPLIIDNTFATPYVTKPLQWGADIVVHSATKWIGGHGTVVGGVVVDGGRFNWGNGKFPEFTEPDESYNGLRYIDVSPAAFATKLRVQLIRDIGACLDANSAFLLLQGLETLHLRIERHNQNAQEVAHFLHDHPAVEWVNYPGLSDHPSHALARKYFQDQFGSVITFGIKGDRHAGKQVIDQVTLWSHVANVGDAKSLIIHPASTTHQQLSAEELEKSGVSEELIRLSVGLESPKDLLHDLDLAISKGVGSQSIHQPSNEDTIKWLLTSPFDRNEEAIRQKTVALIGPENPEDDFYKQALKLEQLGYRIVPITGKQATSQEGTYQTLKDIPFDVDAVWVKDDGAITSEITEQLINKQINILWIEHAADSDPTLENTKAAGITVIANQNPYVAYTTLRENKPLNVKVETYA